MESIHTLMARHHAVGVVEWIGLRPARRVPLTAVDDTVIGFSGLEGDRHPSPGKRAVTLIQAEHLPVINDLAGAEAGFEMLRRNIAVRRINLAALRGKNVRFGTAVLLLTGPCAPCSRMEEVLGYGGYNAMRHHGGWCAEVVTPGSVSLGSAVTPE